MALRTTKRLVALCLCCVLVACQVALPQGGGQGTISVVDGSGTSVEIGAPVERIISTNSGMTALVCALGAQEALVGRDAFSTFPSSLEAVPVVAESSARCDLERIVSMRPNLLIADAMLQGETRDKLAASGVPSYVDSTSDPQRIPALIRAVGTMLGTEERAEEMVAFHREHVALVDERISQYEAAGGQRPRVYFEWQAPLKTASAETDLHQPIAEAGGLNIAATQPVRMPVMDAEWVIAQDPEIIVRRVSGDATMEEMRATREEILQRPGWGQVAAVQSGRVYVIKADVFLTFRYAVGLSYYAKWFHPELFEDLDPEALHREAVEEFLGPEEWTTLVSREAFAYP